MIKVRKNEQKHFLKEEKKQYVQLTKTYLE
jgi:hypothetical protein